MTTDRQLLADLVMNPLYFIPTFMQIEDKERVRKPFVLNYIQEQIIRLLWQEKCTRLNILKASQIGATSGLVGFTLWDTITSPGTTSIIIAHEEFITQRLLHKSAVFYESIPREFKPEIHHNSSYEKSFPDINSTIYIGSARAYVFGRSETIHNLLADEYAFWPDPERIMIPTLQRVPLSGRIMKVSTPNGEENAFCYDWKAAKRGELVGNAVFRNLFFPWWLCPEYKLPLGSPYALERDRGELDLTNEEESLCLKFRLDGIPPSEDQDRMRWRRRKYEEMEQLRQSGESAKFFFQEFPEDDETCFLAVGDMVYDSEQVKRLAENCYRANTTIDNFQVWYPPEEDKRYLVCVDPSMAKQSKTAISVWYFKRDGNNPEEPIQCAEFVGLVGPEVTAKKADRIGRLYNTAEIAIEANSHGLAVVVLMKGYPNLYYRRDVVSQRESSQIGWLTTPKTKPYMIQQLQKSLPFLTTHSINLVTEMRNMRWVGDRAVSMGDDDLHDTAAIAMAISRPGSGKRGFVGQAGWKW